MPDRDPRDLRKLEEIRCIEEGEACRKVLQHEVERVRADAARRGISVSGARFRGEAEARRRFLRCLIESYIRVRKELAQNAPELLEDTALGDLLGRLENIVEIRMKADREEEARITATAGVPTGSSALHRDDVDRAGSLAFARREVEKLKLGRRLGLHQEAGHAMQLRIQDSIIVSLNLGHIVGDVNSNISKLEIHGQAAIASTFKSFAESVAADEDLGDQRREILEMLSTLAEQADRPPDQRKGGVIKSLYASLKEALSTGANAATIWIPYGPAVAKFFDLSP